MPVIFQELNEEFSERERKLRDWEQKVKELREQLLVSGFSSAATSTKFPEVCPTNDKKSVDNKLIIAKNIKKFFLSCLLSDIRPIKGARIISNKLAEEFDMPNTNVLSTSENNEAKFSAKIIG